LTLRVRRQQWDQQAKHLKKLINKATQAEQKARRRMMNDEWMMIV
jgi:23S rRNA maturation mini-RNase III